MVKVIASALRSSWRVWQVVFTLSLVIFEFFSRRFLQAIFRVIPLPYFLELVGLIKEPTTVYSQDDEDEHRSTTEFIESRGYTSEEHFVTTPDGFVLGLHRIPVSRVSDGADDSDQPRSKGVVLFMHGFMQCSEAFIVRKDSDNSLPLLFAKAGYDVWLGNNRGSKYSYKHISKKPDTDEFWDWSLDELIKYDLPSIVNYALSHTGQRKLTLVGFSQGTAQSFACLSSNKDIAEKVKLFIALAPVTYAKGFSNSIVENLVGSRSDFIFLLFGKKEILPSALFWRKVLTREHFVQVMDLCVLFLFGWHTQCLDPEEKALLYYHLYSYSSVKSVVHWFQIIHTKRFQMFNDGSQNNVTNSHAPCDRYTHIETPEYKTRQLTTPVAAFYGGKDNLPNTQALLDALPRDKVVMLHREPEYEHLDFLWAKDVGKNVYPKILHLVENFSEEKKQH